MSPMSAFWPVCTNANCLEERSPLELVPQSGVGGQQAVKHRKCAYSSESLWLWPSGALPLGWGIVRLIVSCDVVSYSQLPIEMFCSIPARPFFKRVEEMQAAEAQRWFWSPDRQRAGLRLLHLCLLQEPSLPRCPL